MRVPPGRVTVVIAGVTAFAWVLTGLGPQAERFDLLAGFIPARVGGLVVEGALPVWLTPLTAALLHANLMHLGFNLLMLVFCGRQVEQAIGGRALAVLYGIGAYAAVAAQYAAGPASVYPMIGASGAVSALVGAYAMLYGQRRPSRLSPEAARWLHIAWLAVAWVAIQFLLGLAAHVQGMAIATAAHVGGFVAGVLLARPLLRWRYRKA